MRFTMIERNKYTDETIHVANWLLLSGFRDDKGDGLAEWIDRAASLTKLAGGDVDEHLAEILEAKIVEALNEAMPESYLEKLDRQHYGDSEDGYRISDDPIYLFLPMIAAALRRACFAQVAYCIMEQTQLAAT
jgi:hypothetical protein